MKLLALTECKENCLFSKDMFQMEIVSSDAFKHLAWSPNWLTLVDWLCVFWCDDWFLICKYKYIICNVCMYLFIYYVRGVNGKEWSKKVDDGVDKKLISHKKRNSHQVLSQIPCVNAIERWGAPGSSLARSRQGRRRPNYRRGRTREWMNLGAVNWPTKWTSIQNMAMGQY